MKIKISVILLVSIIAVAGITAMEMPSKKQKAEEESQLADRSKTELEKISPELASELRKILISNQPELYINFIGKITKEAGEEISKLVAANYREQAERKSKQTYQLLDAVQSYEQRFYADEQLYRNFGLALDSGDIERVKAAYKKLGDNIYGASEELTLVMGKTNLDQKFPGFIMQVVKALLALGAPIAKWALEGAIVIGRLDLIKVLFEHNASLPNAETIKQRLKQYFEQSAEVLAVKKEKGLAMLNLIIKKKKRKLEGRQLSAIEVKRLLDILNKLQLLEPEELIKLQRK